MSPHEPLPSYWWTNYFLTDEEYSTLGRRSLIVVLPTGYLAVDFFFVLTGFLLAHPLFAAYQRRDGGDAADAAQWRACVPSLRVYFFRRIAKVWPYVALLMVVHCFVAFPRGLFSFHMLRNQGVRDLFVVNGTDLAADMTQFPSSCEQGHLNVLFLNHMWPFGGCAGYTWSLSMQVEFYLLLPVLWKLCASRRAFVGAMVAMVVLSTGWRLAQALHLAMFTEPGQLYFLWFSWYTLSFARFGTMALGVLLAYATTSRPEWLAAFEARGSLAALAHWVIAGLFLWEAAPPEEQATGGSTPVWTAVHTVLFQPGGTGIAAAAAYIILALLHGQTAAEVAARRLLSHRVWRHLAPLTFGAYLWHPLLLQWGYPNLLFPLQPTVAALAGYTALAIASTFALAAAVHHAYERPVDRWLRGWIVDAKPAEVGRGGGGTDAKAVTAGGRVQLALTWLVFVYGAVYTAVLPVLHVVRVWVWTQMIEPTAATAP